MTVVVVDGVGLGAVLDVLACGFGGDSSAAAGFVSVGGGIGPAVGGPAFGSPPGGVFFCSLQPVRLVCSAVLSPLHRLQLHRAV